ncbi:hypothetical protein NPIL_48631 [Nephila pilipes]|uniref:Uncharacterized protein n=1 Tax=Nephila pilipes TaxID=299642 RepID=A0A8X6TVF6_NEPPI|nr:hypothetical protein NPIL_501511 [Nephila pilipes]GFT21602.1 hypothetical protein NPIL_349021 [Nephila pilipes]GFT36366.1 hypothetical protein NPIL_297471 [Nephila pilipes]GFT51004.1 hypothetical protein NPIL_48631 [Nephila pilipes]
MKDVLNTTVYYSRPSGTLVMPTKTFRWPGWTSKMRLVRCPIPSFWGLLSGLAYRRALLRWFRLSTSAPAAPYVLSRDGQTRSPFAQESGRE